MTEPQELPEAVEPTAASDRSLDRQLAKMVHHSRRYIYVILALQGVLILALIGLVIWLLVLNNSNVAANARQIQMNQQSSDRRWCATMELLTAAPVQKPSNPSANPSREASYQLYVDFVTLRREFGCK